MLALYAQKLDGSKRFGPRTYPHVEISSKFEVLWAVVSTFSGYMLFSSPDEE